MNEANPDHLFDEIKDDLKDYATKKAELLKLDIYEKSGKVAAVSFSGILIISLVFFILLLLMVSGALYIGKLTGDNSLGFLCMSGLLFVLTLLYFFLFRRMVEYAILNSVIDVLMKKEDEKE